MTVEFYSSHLKTLRDLQNIADKHNCYINFGFNNDYGGEIDEDLLQEHDFDIRELRELELTEEHYSASSIWFELGEMGNGLHHTLTYIERTTSFVFDKNSYSWDFISDEFKEFLEQEDEYENGFIHKGNSITRVKGFGLEKTEESGLVYRSGMALKFFADYVCDYLGEERIVRTY